MASGASQPFGADTSVAHPLIHERLSSQAI